MALNKRQRRFCEELAKGAEARQAAINAGYKPRTAERYAEHNLRNEAVLRELERLQGHNIAELAQPLGDMEEASADEPCIAADAEILAFLTAVMRGRIYDAKQGGSTALPKVSERTKAAELLGRNQKLFTDKERRDGEAIVRIWGEDELR